MLKTIVAALVVALAVAGLATASSQGEKYKLTAKLTAGAEVPKPKGVPAAATGLFTANAVELSGGKARITWKLTFSHLSGKATAAHIHLGKKGTPGGVLFALCGPCKSGQTGKGTVTKFPKIEAGGAYVNVHTSKNPAGEIRGQVRSSS